MSQLAQHEIEDIVRMVIDRLRDSDIVRAQQTRSQPGSNYQSSIQSVGSRETRLSSDKTTAMVSPASNALSPQPGTLVLASPLVTLEDIDGKLTGISQISISKGALLTPAVSDELRKFKIKVVREQAVSSSALLSRTRHEALVYHIIAAPEKLNVIQSVIKQNAVNAIPANLSISEIVSRLNSLESGQRALWCATQPFAVVLACSQASAHLRAAYLYQVQDLNQAVLEIQPNLLVIDDARWPGYQIGRLVQAWSRYGDRGGLA